MGTTRDVEIRVKAKADHTSFTDVTASFDHMIKEINQKMSTFDIGSKQRQALGKDLETIYKIRDAYSRSYNKELDAFNLTRFNSGLSAQKTHIEDVVKIFKQYGATGQAAINNLFASTVTANKEFKKTKTLMDEMWNTMSNTIKWGISSSIMNTFTGAFSEAYGYVKNLDKALNNIRIVGGQSAEQMERFARHANSAAQALGSSTLDYSNAALIYYQQGLSDEQVQQMTDITVKMSNVLGVGAEEVSDYMTAIWNNFYDGSKSLEYYADVITKLGAATASSAEEISTGLEKFAAISKTVGLSYEYATAALTTVTATTRQSAEVVGTAFKTLFARIQDLELGETLDDGTTLGKYSEALQKVGINIKESNGELKDMDKILNEMGAKWSMLTDAQKVSLAQTVAGTRQYTQLVALMDNWGYFTENLQTAYNATGALDKQQSIYLEGTEAHLNAARAAWDEFKSALIDEDTVIFLADLTKILGNLLSTITQGVGGGLPALFGMGGAIAKKYSGQISSSLYSIFNKTAVAQQREKVMQEEELQFENKFFGGKPDSSTTKKFRNINSKYRNVMSEPSKERFYDLMKKRAAAENREKLARELLEEANLFANQMNSDEDIKFNFTNRNYDNILARQEQETLRKKQAKKQSNLSKLENQKAEYIEKGEAAPEELLNRIKKAQYEKEIVEQKLNEVTDRVKATQGEVTQFDIEMSLQEGKKVIDSANSHLVSVEEILAKYDSIDQKFKQTQNDTIVQNSLNLETGEIEEEKSLKTVSYKEAKEELQILETSIEEARIALEELSNTFGKALTPEELQEFETLQNELLEITNLQSKIRLDAYQTTKTKDGKEVTKEKKDAKVEIANINKIKKAQEKAYKALNTATDKFRKKIDKTSETIQSGLTDELHNAIGELTEVNEETDKLEKEWKKVSDIETWTQAGIGLAQLTSGMSSLTNIFDIFYNDSLSGFEKFIQMAISAGTAITFIVGGFKSIVPALLAIESLNKAMAAEKAKRIALSALHLQIEEEATEEEVKQAIAIAAKNSVEEYGVKLTQKEIALQMLKNGEITKEQAKLISGITLKEIDNAVTQKGNGLKATQITLTELLKIAQDKLNLSMLKNPYVLIAAAIVGLIALMGSLVTLYKKHQEEIKKDNEEIIKEEQEEQKLIDKNLELIDSYEKLYKQYKKGEASSEDLSKAAEELIGFINSEDVAVAKLTGDYDKLAEAIKKAREEQLKDKFASAKREQDAAGANLKIAAKGTQGEQHGDQFKLSFEGFDVGESQEEQKAVNFLKEFIPQDWISDDISDFTGNTLEMTVDFTDESISDLYDKIKQAKEKMDTEMTDSEKKRSDIYQETSEWLKEMEDSVTKFQTARGTAEGVDAESKISKLDFDSVDSYEEFEEKYKEYIAYSKKLPGNSEKTDTEIADEAKLRLSKISDEINGYVEQMGAIDALKKVFGEKYIDSIKGVFSELTPQQLSGLTNENNKDVIQEAFKYYLDNPEADSSVKGISNAIKNIGEVFKDTTKPALIFNNELKKQLETLGYSEEDFEEYVEQLLKLNPAFENDIELAKDFAIANIRLNKGVKDLAENFDNLKPVLKENEKGTSGFASALKKAKKIIADVLNLDSDEILSDDFYTSAENLKLMEQAAKGSEKAIEKLRKKAGDNIIKQFKVGVEDESVLNALDGLNNLVKNYDLSDIEVGMSVNDKEFVDSLNEYIVAAKMTKEQAERYLNSMNLKGVETEPHTDYIEHELEIPFGPFTFKKKYTEKVTYPQFKNVQKIGEDKPKIDTKSPGGGSKSKKELPTNEKDPYHDINIELEQLEQRLEKIGKIREGLLGQDYIDKLREEYELLNKTIEKTEEKLKVATKEQEKLKNSLAGMGAKFNSDGSISNYGALYDKEFKRYEDAVKKYNAGKLSEKNLEKAEKRWEKFQEDLDKYDELLIDIIPELEMNILEKELEQFELKMDGFTYSIEMRLDLKEAEQDWNEFIKDLNYRDNEIMGEVVLNRNNLDSLFKEDGSGIIQSLTNQINNTIAEIEEIETTGSSDIYGTNKEQAMEDLETYAGEMREALLELQDIQDNLHQSYVDMMDETQEKLDEQIEAYETITDLIEHEKELISLTYGEDSYEELSALYDKQLENNKQQLDALRQQTAFWHSQMLTLEEGSDEWEAAKEKWLAAVQAEKEAILSSIQELQDWYLNEIDKMFDNINKNVTGGLGLDYASKEWDLINKNADQYLDNVNAIYSIQQLQNKYLDAIENTDNLGTQKKLNDLMKQELATLREQDKLSQYDIDRANLKYEIALKQMALEEAQQNKNTMRLRRDSQGNYTYQYVADEDEISSVQEELANLYNELYNMDYDKYRENLAEITEIWTEAQEQMREAAQINDPDERARQEKLIQEQYGQLINSLVEQNETLKSNMYQSTMSQLFDLYDQNAENYDLMTEEQKLILDNFLTEETNLEGAAFDNLFDLYNENIEQFKNMTDAQQEELMGSLLPQWETAYQQMADTIRGEGGFFEVYKTTFEDMKTLANEYLEMLLQITQSENYEEIKNSNEELFTNLEEFVGKTDEILEAYDAQLAKIAEVIAEVENLILKYKQAEESALAAAEAGQGVIEEEKKEDSTLDVDLDDNQDDTSDPDDGTDESDASKASNGAPFKDTYTVKRGDTLSGIGSRYGVNYERIYAENRGVIGSDPDLIKPGMKLKIPAYQSGGYTGDWAGTGGQLAMLHKKELVLNASDTKNLLGAMDILRSITDNLGASLFNTISAISAHGASPAWANAGGDSLQQDVHITAEFPNVTNSHEIEDALNNLVNHASQYIQK